MDSTNSIVPVERTWEQAKASAISPGGKFNEKRRAIYLEERRQGTPHLTALRRADISPSTHDRYSAAIGQQWKNTVRYAVEEGLDPIRAVRRAAALEGEPWAVRAEIGDGRAASGGASGGEGPAGSTTVNIGAVVVGGEAGVAGALHGILDRLRERERAIAGGDGSEHESA
jgi:hypothetical protein